MRISALDPGCMEPAFHAMAFVQLRFRSKMAPVSAAGDDEPGRLPATQDNLRFLS